MALDGTPITYITAGAGGMYCGSCMHDNALAAELTRQGVDIQLIPTYTPIRTDELDVSERRVFFGGINVFLQQRVGIFRHIPRFLDRVLDQPRLIRWATGRQVKITPESLGELTLSMLRGESGYQRKEVTRLLQWLANSVRPGLVNFSNVLIAGCVPAMKRQLNIPIIVTLQGDDIFLEQLPASYRSQALSLIRELTPHVDVFFTHSQYYADFMSTYLEIPRERFRIVKLGVDVEQFAAVGQSQRDGPPSVTIGYLARIAPEKGLHILCEAFARLRDRSEMSHVRLRVAGWLGEHQRKYLSETFGRLDAAGLRESYEYVGELTRDEKVRFLHESDLFSVPTTYREPKGLYLLEALAAGCPVVQPSHGAFPELIDHTGGGRLVPPNDPQALAESLAGLILNEPERLQLAAQGRQSVVRDYSLRSMARSHIDAYEDLVAIQ